MSTGKIEMLNRTDEAVRKQVAAMAAGVFEVGVFDSESGRMILRTWNEEAIIKSIPWLRFENLKGRNIYIRPAGIHSLSLVDDLTSESVRRMQTQGFSPAVVVETSPCNFQAWMQHGTVLDTALSTAVAKALARRFQGDQGSADWRHFGRLGGFTNRKEKHRQANGLFHYVRIIEATGRMYEKATVFVHEIDGAEKEQRRQSQAARTRCHVKLPTGTVSKGIRHFRNDPKYGGAQSRSDIAYAVYALDHGVSEDAVRDAIVSQGLSFKGSPSRQEDYLERTIQKARQWLARPQR
jgi:hypothetical protein